MDQYFEKASELAHLSESDIETLYGRYLCGEKNADLLLEYKIEVEPRALLKVLPPIISKDLRCPYCDVPMWAKRRAKTTRESDAPPFKCLQCEHTFFAVGHFGRRMGCTCVECFRVKQQALAAQAQLDRDELAKRYGVIPQPVPCRTLGFMQKLGLLALLESRAKPGLERIEPLASMLGAELLAPDDEASEALLRQLFEAGVLVVDLDSTIKAFDRENAFGIRDFSAIRWQINVALDNTFRSSHQALYVALNFPKVFNCLGKVSFIRRCLTWREKRRFSSFMFWLMKSTLCLRPKVAPSRWSINCYRIFLSARFIISHGLR